MSLGLGANKSDDRDIDRRRQRSSLDAGCGGRLETSVNEWTEREFQATRTRAAFYC